MFSFLRISLQAIVLCCVFQSIAVTGACAASLNELRGLKTRQSRFPVYHKERLQLMIYSAEAEHRGDTVLARDPVMDIIRRGIDIDLVGNAQKNTPYSLEAPLVDILAFWTQRLYSEGVISSTSAVINQETNQASGNDPVFFRSPMLDLDGVGFDADYASRTLLVRQNVHIVLRTAASNPVKLLEEKKLPEKYEHINAYANSLFIDFDRGEVILSGEVKIDEERATVNCDRLTIFFDGRGGDRTGEAGEDDLFAESGIDGVNRVICEGHVVIVRKNGVVMPEQARQSAASDRAEYRVKHGTVTLTGSPDNPSVLRCDGDILSGEVIEYHRFSGETAVRGHCRLFACRVGLNGDLVKRTELRSDAISFDRRHHSVLFSGNVLLDESDTSLSCGMIYASLGSSVKNDAEEAATEIALMPEFDSMGRMELMNVECHDNVRVLCGSRLRQTGSIAGIRRHTLGCPGQSEFYIGLAMPSCRRTHAVNCEKYVNIPAGVILCSNHEQPADAVQTVITSDSSDFNYGDNLLTFKGNVRVQDSRLTLECDEIKIHLRDTVKDEHREHGKSDHGGSFGLDSGYSRNKHLASVVCIGDVHVVEKQFFLDCDMLTLYFRQMQGTLPEPGALQSGETQLIRIDTEGNVELRSRQGASGGGKDSGNRIDESSASDIGTIFKGSKGVSVLTAEHGRIDLLKNVAEFHGKVRAEDPQATLDCDSLFLLMRIVTDGSDVGTRQQENPIDRDPFVSTATEVPNAFALGDSRELTDVVAQHHVRITRKLLRGVQYATCDQAHYIVNDRSAVLLGTPQRLPYLEDPVQGRMQGKRIFLDLANERASVEEQASLEIKNLNSL